MNQDYIVEMATNEFSPIIEQNSSGPETNSA
jgi:hypothetical protein